jgi:hypothetical protein
MRKERQMNPKYIIAIHNNPKRTNQAQLFGFPSLKLAKAFGRETGRPFAIAKAINPKLSKKAQSKEARIRG